MKVWQAAKNVTKCGETGWPHTQTRYRWQKKLWKDIVGYKKMTIKVPKFVPCK